MEFRKDPDAEKDYAVSWGTWLAGDTLATSSWEVEPAGLTLGAAGLTDDTTTVFLSGGTIGVRYAVTNHVTTAGGRAEDHTLYLRIASSVADLPDLPATCWPVDTSVCDTFAAADPSDQDTAVALAGQTMRLLTGYSLGGCPVLLRPCRQGAVESTWQAYPVAGRPTSGFAPVLSSGQWLNLVCGCGALCSCGGVTALELPTSGTVQAVIIDGEELPTDAWRVSGRQLYRVDGGVWPTAQNLAAPETVPGTWAVLWTPGASVDGLGARAAGLLACEYLKAIRGDTKCALPAGVTQVARQGVTMTITTGVFPDGLTGIREVDTYIQSVNPYQLKAPPRVWSPDVARPVVTNPGPPSSWPTPPQVLDGGDADD